MAVTATASTNYIVEHGAQRGNTSSDRGTKQPKGRQQQGQEKERGQIAHTSFTSYFIYFTRHNQDYIKNAQSPDLRFMFLMTKEQKPKTESYI